MNTEFQPSWVTALAIFGGSIVLGALVRVVVLRWLGAIFARTSTKLDDLALKAIGRHVPFWFFLGGVVLATRFTPIHSTWIPLIDKTCAAVFILSASLAVARFGAGALDVWTRESGAAVGTTSLMQYVVKIVVLSLGVLIILSNLGISITPLLTALGVSSLAVALALQPTLSNLFAGIHLALARPIRVGDYVRLETQNEGFVVDIGWRATRIRELPNNIIVVPNSRVVEMIFTNYDMPESEQSALVQVGVSYGSDLEKVERVTIEVARDVLRTVEGGVATFDPFIRYHTFGDSSIDFSVILRVKKFPDRYLVTHEFVKRLKARYDREGIEIPFPQRVVTMIGGKAALFLVPLLALSLFAQGCGPSASRAGADRVALMVPPSERPFWEPIARGFERAHPGVAVDLTEGPQSTDLRENLYTAALLARDPSFDLVYLDVTWTPKFAAAGWLLPLDDAFPAEERDRFLPAAIGAGWYGGRLYRIPVRTDVGLLYWRRDWIEEAGRAPPRTFADLVATAEALQRPPERWGFVWQGKQYEGLVCFFLEVLRGFGGTWIDPATRRVGLDRPPALDALRFLVRCVRVDKISPPGVTTYQEEESRHLFQDGRAVFLRNWPYVWRLAQADESPLRGRVGAGPMVHAEGGVSAGTLGGWGLGVSRFSRRPDLAVAFVRYATTLESERLLCATSGYAPALRAAYDDSTLLRANPFLAEIARVHASAVARPTVARYALVSDILQRHLSAALTGADTPEHALRAAARETRLALGDAAAGGGRP
ncbi:MAG: extracellular solute-binding protein [Hyphomicrobiales bacterium]